MEKVYDVAIVGGGIAGTVAAWTLKNCGLSVAFIDDHVDAIPVFRAERISQLTATTLQDLGLFDRLEKNAVPLHSTATIKNSRVEKTSQNTDYSIPLWKLVADLRTGMASAGVDVIVDRATDASTSATIQSLQLRSGATVQCKLFVVATGNAASLLKSLGINRDVISPNHSTTFGFNIECGDDFKLPSDSVSIRIYKDGVDYLNLFPTPEGTYRGNLFTYWPGNGQKVREFIKGDTNAQLDRLAPHMKKVTGEWRAVGRVQSGSMSVVKSTGFEQQGFVLIGDAYGRICPCLGNGIQKALRDILSLQSHVPGWLSRQDPMTWSTIKSYYQDPPRQSFEDHLFKYSLFIRDRLINKAFGWQLRRWYYDRLPLAARNLVREVKQWSWGKSQKKLDPLFESENAAGAIGPAEQEWQKSVPSGDAKPDVSQPPVRATPVSAAPLTNQSDDQLWSQNNAIHVSS